MYLDNALAIMGMRVLYLYASDFTQYKPYYACVSHHNCLFHMHTLHWHATHFTGMPHFTGMHILHWHVIQLSAAVYSPCGTMTTSSMLPPPTPIEHVWPNSCQSPPGGMVFLHSVCTRHGCSHASASTPAAWCVCV